MIPLLLQGSEWIIVIVVVVFLLFGASKLPDIAKSLGKAGGEFRKGAIEGEQEIEKLKASMMANVNPPPTDPNVRTYKAPSQPDVDPRVRMLKAASELGISTDGKTDDEIRAEIRKALS